MHGDEDVKSHIVGFAANKVRGKVETGKPYRAELACVATRVPIQFDYLSNAALKIEKDLVTNHMRLSLGPTGDVEHIYTIPPSEPLLAEGARQEMLNNGNISKALKWHSDHHILDVGRSGELVVAVLLLTAQDHARVPSEEIGGLSKEPRRSVPLKDFLGKFLGEAVHKEFWTSEPSYVHPNDPDARSLQDRYPNARVWFNHFIEVQDSDVISTEYLWRYLLRGAALVCRKSQEGIDILIPFLLDAEEPIGPSNISVVLVQVKNDVKFSENVDDELFMKMDPYNLGIFSPSEPPRAVVRIVCALAASTAGCKMVKRGVARLAREAKFEAMEAISGQLEVEKPSCASFDFWCHGATQSTFRSMGKDEEANYHDILFLEHRKLRIFSTFGPQFMSDPDKGHITKRELARRILSAGALKDSRHWTKFAS
jgi:hypothetical protein